MSPTFYNLEIHCLSLACHNLVPVCAEDFHLPRNQAALRGSDSQSRIASWKLTTYTQSVATLQEYVDYGCNWIDGESAFLPGSCSMWNKGIPNDTSSRVSGYLQAEIVNNTRQYCLLYSGRTSLHKSNQILYVQSEHQIRYG